MRVGEGLGVTVGAISSSGVAVGCGVDVVVISGVDVGVVSSGEVALNLRPKKKAKARRPITIIEIRKVTRGCWFLAGVFGISSSAISLL